MASTLPSQLILSSLRYLWYPINDVTNLSFPCHLTPKLYCVNHHLSFVSSEVCSQLADVLFLQWKQYGVETIKSCYNRLYKTYVSNRMFPSSAKFLSSRTKAWSRKKLHVLLRLISSTHVGIITPVWDYCMDTQRLACLDVDNIQFFLYLYLSKHDHEINFSNVTDIVGHDDVINENIFRATGPLCGESTSHRWIPLTTASDAEVWCFLWSLPKQTFE